MSRCFELLCCMYHRSYRSTFYVYSGASFMPLCWRRNSFRETFCYSLFEHRQVKRNKKKKKKIDEELEWSHWSPQMQMENIMNADSRIENSIKNVRLSFNMSRHCRPPSPSCTEQKSNSKIHLFFFFFLLSPDFRRFGQTEYLLSILDAINEVNTLTTLYNV